MAENKKRQYYGGGRKKSERPIIRVNRTIYADQSGVTSEEIREAIDRWRKERNAEQ